MASCPADFLQFLEDNDMITRFLFQSSRRIKSICIVVWFWPIFQFQLSKILFAQQEKRENVFPKREE